MSGVGLYFGLGLFVSFGLFTGMPKEAISGSNS
jgi:hypothetical protein